MLSLCHVIQRCLCVTPLGFCLRVIVNEKQTTSSALSVCSIPCNTRVLVGQCEHKTLDHRLITIQIEHYMSYFKVLRGFRSQ